MPGTDVPGHRGSAPIQTDPLVPERIGETTWILRADEGGNT